MLKEVACRVLPEGKLEREAALEQPARHDAAALQNQLRLRPHEDRADFEHPAGRGQADRHAQAASRSVRMNSAFGSGFGDATLTGAGDVVMSISQRPPARSRRRESTR